MMAIKPVNLREAVKNVSNIYEAVIVASRKARLINDANRLEYNTLLSNLIPETEDEFDDRSNPDQEKLSVEFEKRPKPQLQALDELMKDGIPYRYKEDEAV